jgi:RNA polymerase sigma factor (sigma-70 family)
VSRKLRQDEEFRLFAVKFVPTLLRAAYMLVRDVDLAEDVVQATMLRVFRRWDQAQELPEAYSRQVLVNVCRDHWRRQSRRPREVSGNEADRLVSTVSFSDEVERRQAIDQALSQLTGLQREVVVARFYFDLSVEQTSTLLDVPAGTVKSATHRGLQQLRGLLVQSEGQGV